MTRQFLTSLPPNRRDIHSIPTRRSSDLSRCCEAPASDRDYRRSAVTTKSASRARSEEHTSELHLVCRLLLEKKNSLSFAMLDIDIPTTCNGRCNRLRLH